MSQHFSHETNGRRHFVFRMTIAGLTLVLLRLVPAMNVGDEQTRQACSCHCRSVWDLSTERHFCITQGPCARWRRKKKKEKKNAAVEIPKEFHDGLAGFIGGYSNYCDCASIANICRSCHGLCIVQGTPRAGASVAWHIRCKRSFDDADQEATGSTRWQNSINYYYSVLFIFIYKRKRRRNVAL